MVGSKRSLTSEGQIPEKFQRLPFEPWDSGRTGPGVGSFLSAASRTPNPRAGPSRSRGAGSERGLVVGPYYGL